MGKAAELSPIYLAIQPIRVCVDGRHNPHKRHEDLRRQQRAERAQRSGMSYGQIRNTPEYIALAVAVCKFMQIEVVVSAYEANWQVMHRAIPDSLTAITGDSDLLDIGPSKMPAGYTPSKIMIVSS
jgi:5'-3' exonuclease